MDDLLVWSGRIIPAARLVLSSGSSRLGALFTSRAAMQGGVTLDDAYAAAAGDYPAVRRADPRIAARIVAAVRGGSVLNVGAGAGSYEADVGTVAAVEPSAAMLRRRQRAAAPGVRARAESLPLRRGCIDVALAVLTIHHWGDLDAGLAELRRVARRRVVLLTWDPAFARRFWLSDYLPEALVEWDAGRFPPMHRLLARLRRARSEVVPIPHDCTDGFLGAYWRRPLAYLSASARLGISSLANREDELASVWPRLEADVRSGAWHARNGGLLALDELDLGYRLVVSDL
jgi:SAM-dependent methyltransferase